MQFIYTCSVSDVFLKSLAVLAANEWMNLTKATRGHLVAKQGNTGHAMYAHIVFSMYNKQCAQLNVRIQNDCALIHPCLCVNGVNLTRSQLCVVTWHVQVCMYAISPVKYPDLQCSHTSPCQSPCQCPQQPLLNTYFCYNEVSCILFFLQALCCIL